MKLRFEWSREAERDLRETWEYIVADNEAAADRLLARLLTRAEALSRSPRSGRTGRATGTRELPVAGTKYILIYLLPPGAVRIVRVLHGARQWPPAR